MKETVTVIPTVDHDRHGNPVPQGPPLVVTPLEIAPGNATMRPGQGGDLTDVEFTIYLPRRIHNGSGFSETETLVKNGYEIRVRDRSCIAMIQVWKSQQSASRGGVVVLARSKSGKSQ